MMILDDWSWNLRCELVSKNVTRLRPITSCSRDPVIMTMMMLNITIITMIIDQVEVCGPGPCPLVRGKTLCRREKKAVIQQVGCHHHHWSASWFTYDMMIVIWWEKLTILNLYKLWVHLFNLLSSLFFSTVPGENTFTFPFNRYLKKNVPSVWGRTVAQSPALCPGVYTDMRK